MIECAFATVVRFSILSLGAVAYLMGLKQRPFYYFIRQLRILPSPFAIIPEWARFAMSIHYR